MNYAWQVATLTLSLVCICCFCTFIDYKKQSAESELAYSVLLEEYLNIEEENHFLKNELREEVLQEISKIDEYISWKEGLTSLHEVYVPNIEITDKDREEFWKNYFICRNMNIDTTLDN